MEAKLGMSEAGGERGEPRRQMHIQSDKAFDVSEHRETHFNQNGPAS
jgi:hypothetical protein